MEPSPEVAGELLPVFVALDLPFALDFASPSSDLEDLAQSYPQGRKSEVIEFLGGADYIEANTLLAPPKRSSVRVNARHDRVLNSRHPDDGLEQRCEAFQPFKIPQPLDSDAASVWLPVFRGAVQATNDLLLHIKRDPVTNAPHATIVGPIRRTVIFDCPASFAMLDPDLEAPPGKLSRPESVTAARTRIDPPAEFLSPLTAGLSGYALRDHTKVITASIRALNVDHKEATYPAQIPQSTAEWLRSRVRSADDDILRTLLEEKPIASVTEFLTSMRDRGLHKLDFNKYHLRARTYRLLGGPFDRLLCRVGFDPRATEHRDVAAPHQRIMVRASRDKVRLYRSLLQMPDLEEGISAAEAQLESSTEREEFRFIAEYFRRNCMFMVAEARELARIASISTILTRSLLPAYDVASGWYSADGLAQVTLMFREAIQSFTSRVIDHLEFAPFQSQSDLPAVVPLPPPPLTQDTPVQEEDQVWFDEDAEDSGNGDDTSDTDRGSGLSDLDDIVDD